MDKLINSQESEEKQEHTRDLHNNKIVFAQGIPEEYKDYLRLAISYLSPEEEIDQELPLLEKARRERILERRYEWQALLEPYLFPKETSELPKTIRAYINILAKSRKAVNREDAPRKFIRKDVDESERLRSEMAELRLENERLKTLIAESRKSENRAIHNSDEAAARVDKMLDVLKEANRANTTLQAALTGREAGRLRMFESYEGVVKHVSDNEAVILFEIEDELIEHTYKRKQFIDEKLPERGDRIAVYVHVELLPQERKEIETPLRNGKNRGEHRKQRIFKTGPLEF